MKYLALIKSALEAVIAIPKILESLSQAVEQLKLNQVNEEYKKQLADLSAKVDGLTKAKTDAEIASAVHALNNRR